VTNLTERKGSLGGSVFEQAAKEHTHKAIAHEWKTRPTASDKVEDMAFQRK
jgi:hypothetical protein